MLHFFRLQISGNVYKGEWLDGVKHGKGIFTDSSGNEVCPRVFATLLPSAPCDQLESTCVFPLVQW